MKFFRKREETPGQIVQKLQEAGVVELCANEAARDLAVRAYLSPDDMDKPTGIPSYYVGMIASEASLPDLISTPEGRAQLYEADQFVREAMRR